MITTATISIIVPTEPSGSVVSLEATSPIPASLIPSPVSPPILDAQGLAMIDADTLNAEVFRRALEAAVAEDARRAAEARRARKAKARAARAAAAPTLAATPVPSGSGLPAILWAIARCEGYPGFVYRDHGHSTSSASGKFGFLDSTWRSWRGAEGAQYARAMHAPEWVQDRAAIRLYSNSGTRPWNASRSCWG